MSNEFNNALLQSIIDEANAQAIEIIATARTDARKKVEDNDKKIQKALEREKDILKNSLAVMEARYSTLKQSATRRNQLRRHTALYDEVMTLVDKKFEELPKRKNYPDLILSWIVEGCISIELPEVIVNCDKNAKVDQEMIEKAKEIILQKTGLPIKVKLGFNQMLGTGVVISSMDGRISFNNLISSRLRRYNREVNEIVEGAVCRKE
ncbi:MAG: V-type ATP synthase subunit E family protein [Sphaerochaetaceae bacterium]|nr:V-type ATP synthase subunit E family protein [Sphaerochaetaceae bacterium]